MEITLYCDSHGDVKIKDVIIDLDGTNLDGGVNIHDAWGNLLCEIPDIARMILKAIRNYLKKFLIHYNHANNSCYYYSYLFV
jgi:hypothetical protein